jgi:hypothetical protein
LEGFWGAPREGEKYPEIDESLESMTSSRDEEKEEKRTKGEIILSVCNLEKEILQEENLHQITTLELTLLKEGECSDFET